MTVEAVLPSNVYWRSYFQETIQLKEDNSWSILKSVIQSEKFKVWMIHLNQSNLISSILIPWSVRNTQRCIHILHIFVLNHSDCFQIYLNTWSAPCLRARRPFVADEFAKEITQASFFMNITCWNHGNASWTGCWITEENSKYHCDSCVSESKSNSFHHPMSSNSMES